MANTKTTPTHSEVPGSGLLLSDGGLAVEGVATASPWAEECGVGAIITHHPMVASLLAALPSPVLLVVAQRQSVERILNFDGWPRGMDDFLADNSLCRS